MCEYNQLHVGPNGYVVWCKHCGHYQLCYRNTVLTLNSTDVNVLRTLISCVLKRDQYDFDELRQIMMPTPYTGVSLLLSREELREVENMLERAENEMTAQAMLALFEED